MTNPLQTRKFYIETYGCQMNVADSEVIATVLTGNNFDRTDEIETADIILINTCAIREHAEKRVYGRLDFFNSLKKKNANLKIGIVGCMAERLKDQLLKEKPFIDMVVGPDAYRHLPEMFDTIESGQKVVNVILSKAETYEGILPTRYDSNGISAFISITRGCDNMCAYCVVPFTRGRERSRLPEDILKEVNAVKNDGFKEITLIGQNVDKYLYVGKNRIIDFPALLKMVASSVPEMRVRFSTSYPQDFTEEVVLTMKEYQNICRYIHLPVQSGSNRILDLMKRGYTREWYLDRIAMIRKHLPGCAISTDIIAGFCNETDADHHDTLDLMKRVKFDFAYMFKYSERPNTFAARNFEDDIDEKIKKRRLNEIITLQQKLSLQSNEKDVGKVFEVLIEGFSKKSDDRLFGRNSQNKVIVFNKEDAKTGDYVNVKVNSCTSATLLGEILK
ncbi:MAG: tRNA (N6-isopentenyl adenosine(37)-C2)-methylthiotransferase MiaB [Bacteroidales bacterium]|nr:tRNA (N6-isopentenyl adenosine(37)-C2)-methylthiotransferase MiaB [Bacteroidales bacterium]